MLVAMSCLHRLFYGTSGNLCVFYLLSLRKSGDSFHFPLGRESNRKATTGRLSKTWCPDPGLNDSVHT